MDPATAAGQPLPALPVQVLAQGSTTLLDAEHVEGARGQARGVLRDDVATQFVEPSRSTAGSATS